MRKFLVEQAYHNKRKKLPTLDETKIRAVQHKCLWKKIVAN